MLSFDTEWSRPVSRDLLTPPSPAMILPTSTHPTGLYALCVVSLIALSPSVLLAQAESARSGPYVLSAGAVYEIPSPEIATPTDMT